MSKRLVCAETSPEAVSMAVRLSACDGGPESRTKRIGRRSTALPEAEPQGGSTGRSHAVVPLLPAPTCSL